MNKILCPIRENLIGGPGHQMYGVNYFEKVSNGQVVPIIFAFSQSKYGKKEFWEFNFKIAWKALTTQHDALYYGIDPDNLVLLCFLKQLGIYRKPIFCWQYTAIKKTNSTIKNFILKLYHNAFNKIFMITEDHVPTSYAEGILKSGKLQYMPWGEDLDYIDQLKVEKKTIFTFISTGKAHRDYETMIKAMSKVSNARLKMYVSPNWGGQCVDIEKLEKEKTDNVELFVVNRPLSYKEIFSDLLQSHCALCICKPVDFGVGYTQVLDSLACGLPCILTWNKDNPINIDEEKVGYTVPPMDVDALAIAMQKIVDETDITEAMRKNSRKLVEEKYNIVKTAQIVVNIILGEINT